MESKTETLVRLEIKLVDTAFAGIRDLRDEVEKGATEEPWFGRLLISILNSTLREYLHLKIGHQKSTPFLSWACRNLLELSIFSKYICVSKANANRFVDDRIVDGIEIFESFRLWVEHVRPGQQLPGLDQVLGRLKKEQAKAVQGGTKFLRTSELAKIVGMQKEFQYMNKLCSKTVHPTAWSVLTEINEGELKAFRPILLFSGVHYGLQIHATIKTHLDKFGPEPPV